MEHIPKAEIHVHLEGSFPPSLARTLAERHKMQLPAEVFGAHETYAWMDFLHFLKVFDVVSTVVKTPEDYRDITYDYLVRTAKQGVIYSEVMPSPDHAYAQGMSYENMLEGVVAGIEEAERETGIQACIYISCVRHFGVDKCEALARTIARSPHDKVRGFGMGGDEVGYPAKLFKKTYEIIAGAGLGCTAHAGEHGGPASVREAITYLPITRVGHGVQSIEDSDLLFELKDRNITLEVCPTSNVALKVYPDYKAHPFNALRAAGVPVTLNSDDPPFFSTSIGNEYQVAHQHFGLSKSELIDITRNTIAAGFIDEKQKQLLLQKCESHR